MIIHIIVVLLFFVEAVLTAHHINVGQYGSAAFFALVAQLMIGIMVAQGR